MLSSSYLNELVNPQHQDNFESAALPIEEIVYVTDAEYHIQMRSLLTAFGITKEQMEEMTDGHFNHQY